MNNPDTIRIKEVGGFGEYIVESRSTPGSPHHVNLTGRDGAGVCTCEHFRFTANPNYTRQRAALVAAGNKDARPFISYRKGRAGCTECLHIATAREHFTKFRQQQFFSAFANHPTPEQFADALRLLTHWPKAAGKRPDPDYQREP